MINYSVTIEGLDELERDLVAMGTKMGTKVLKGALMAASKPLLEEMKATVPTSPPGRVRKVKLRGGKKKGQEVIIEPGFLKSRIKRTSRVNKSGVNKRFAKNKLMTINN